MYMGFFSFKTGNTYRSISNRHSTLGALPVAMVLPDNSRILEFNYDGYGIFGGVDVFKLIAELNGLKTRSEGIEFYHSNAKDKILPRFAEVEKDPRVSTDPYWALAPMENDPAQGYFYDDDRKKSHV